MIRRRLLLLAALSVPLVPGLLEAQESTTCGTDRMLSTLVGAGLGGVAAAIPATIVHRHDQATSHRIVAVSIPAGAVIGFFAAGRDRPCARRADEAAAEAVVSTRSSHAGKGALAGAAIGIVAGAVGSTFYNIGCTRDPCDATRQRVAVTVFSAGEGAIAFGILGGLIGWAWPVGR